MSTKMSLYYKDDMHLYMECFDEESVYLKVCNGGVKVTLEIKMADFAKLSGTVDLSSMERQAAVTDEEILSYCRKQVDQRMASDGLMKFCGAGIFGLSDSPADTQIKQGVDFFTTRRDQLRSILEEVRSSRHSKVNFGLESIVDSRND